MIIEQTHNYYRVLCDGCGTMIPDPPGAPSEEEAREAARKDGWASCGAEHYCWACIQRGQQAAADLAELRS